MKMWRLTLIAVVLAVAAFPGCKPRTVVIRQYEPAPPPPPPATVYVRAPAPVYVPPPPPPAPVAVALPVAPAASDVEVLTRGPVHEAFGELIAYGPQAGLVVSHAPPAPVAEIPPDERPADPRIVWIPGYWTWDDDRNDFTWVSGCWRFPPPGCAWMPGYWTQVPAGFQWVAGFWLPSSAQQVVYQPAPPATMEMGPPGLAPADTYVWVPGYWLWTGREYVWQPGYWSIAQRDWVWVPAHYVYAPRGCIFVAGYWDHAIARRGVLFAPVYFGHRAYLRAGFYYSPAYALDTHVLVINLFARPQYSHYYFGDYYDVRYVSMGIHPWFESRERHGWYDPIAVHEEWRRRHDDPMWERRERERFANLRENVAARPAHTFAAQEVQVARLPKAQRSEAQMAAPLSQVAERPSSQMRFEKINEQERQKIGKQATEVHKYGEARAKWEAPPPPAAGVKRDTPRTEAAPPATRGAPPTAVKRPDASGAPTTRTAVPPTTTPPTVVAPPKVVVPPRGGTPPTVTPPVTTPPTVIAPPKAVAPPRVVTPPTTTQLKEVAPPRTVTPPKEVTPPTVVAPPKVVTPPRVVTPPTVTPPTVRRPEDVRQPPATVAPIAPPTTVKRPEEVRPPEKVNIPKPPIVSKPPEPREVQPPPRPEPPKTVGPVAPRAEQPGPARGKDDEKDARDDRRR